MSERKRALILGGNRFMGRHLALELLKRNYHVTLLNRGHIDDGLGAKVHRLTADRTDDSQLTKALGSEKWDIVFDQICYDAYVADLACRVFNGRTQRYVFVSTISVYEAGEDLRETDFEPRSHSFSKVALSTESYAEAKRQCEAVFAQRASFPTAMVRLPFVIGTDDYTERLKWHVERITTGRPMFFPNLDARTVFIRSDHAGKAIADLGESSHTGPLNCAAPGAIRLKDLMGKIEKISGEKAVLRDESDVSPYGQSADKVMNLSRLHALGIQVPELQTWLDDLISELVVNA